MIVSPQNRLRVFDFDHAIVREAGASAINGIRSDKNSNPSLEGIVREHHAYVSALRKAGLSVDVLPPLEAYPDSVFVEDPALVLPEGAILLRPGAAARVGEAEEMRATLARHFPIVLELDNEGNADGGDVLITPAVIFIGLSKRTNLAGARSLRQKLATLGRAARIVETPAGILHFKTGVSLLNEDTVVAANPIADSGIFADFKIVRVPKDEQAAANLLRVNDAVFVGENYPRTIDLIARECLNIVRLPVSEIAKLDAGLSCMSLRWHIHR